MGRLQTGDRLLPFSFFWEQICSRRAGVGVEAVMPLYCQPRNESHLELSAANRESK
jgi:hypothetical protein